MIRRIQGFPRLRIQAHALNQEDPGIRRSKVQIVLPTSARLALSTTILSRYNNRHQDNCRQRAAEMTLPIELDRMSRVPIYQQIAGQIKQLISTGSLPAGARLPTIRHLAEQMGITRLTVQTAYAE